MAAAAGRSSLSACRLLLSASSAHAQLAGCSDPPPLSSSRITAVTMTWPGVGMGGRW